MGVLLYLVWQGIRPYNLDKQIEYKGVSSTSMVPTSILSKGMVNSRVSIAITLYCQLVHRQQLCVASLVIAVPHQCSRWNFNFFSLLLDTSFTDMLLYVILIFIFYRIHKLVLHYPSLILLRIFVVHVFIRICFEEKQITCIINLCRSCRVVLRIAKKTLVTII